jgi:hypothetical protein
VARYTFTVRDLHSLLLAGLPGAPKIKNYESTRRGDHAQLSVPARLHGSYIFYRRRSRLPTVSVELLGGNTSLAQYLFPLTFVMINIAYGGAAVLIRETAARGNKGLPSIILLGVAYGMVNEGLTTKGFFDPHRDEETRNSLASIPSSTVRSAH